MIQFKETPHERWLIPRPIAFFESEPVLEGHREPVNITLSAFLPFEEENQSSDAAQGAPKKQSTKIRVLSAPNVLASTLTTWAGPEATTSAAKLALTKKIIAKEISHRVFVEHRIREIRDRPLLTQLQAAASPYAMKSIKPSSAGEGSKSKRAPRQRKSTTDAASGATSRKRGSQSKGSQSNGPSESTIIIPQSVLDTSSSAGPPP